MPSTADPHASSAANGGLQMTSDSSARRKRHILWIAIGLISSAAVPIIARVQSVPPCTRDQSERWQRASQTLGITAEDESRTLSNVTAKRFDQTFGLGLESTRAVLSPGRVVGRYANECRLIAKAFH